MATIDFSEAPFFFFLFERAFVVVFSQHVFRVEPVGKVSSSGGRRRHGHRDLREKEKRE